MMPRYQIVETAGGFMSPIRRHSKRRNGGKASYHRRIQKKWTKRFGEKWVETQRRGEVFILGGTTMLVRREDAHELRAAQNKTVKLEHGPYDEVYWQGVKWLDENG
jgi:hypothetical protein